MKRKSKTRKNLQPLSRTTQKTFIVTAVLAYIAQAVMIIQPFTFFVSEQLLPLSSWAIYPITAVILPLLAFIVIYYVSGSKYVKLWRLCQAMLITLLAITLEAFLSAVNMAVFQSQLGYASIPAESGAVFLLLIPPVLTLLLTTAVALWQRSRNKIQSEATPIFQKAFVILFPSLAVAQMVVGSIGFWGGGVSDQRFDPGIVAGVFASLAVPAIVFGGIYLLTPARKTILQRIFVSMTYLIIGILLLMAFASASYLISLLYAVAMNGETSGYITSLAMLFGLVAFIVLVVVHKIKNLL